MNPSIFNINKGKSVKLKCKYKINIRWYLMKVYMLPEPLGQTSQNLYINNVDSKKSGTYLCYKRINDNSTFVGSIVVRIFGKF